MELTTDPLIYEDVLNCTFDVYERCVERAQMIFTEQSVVQSCAATLFINVNKETPSVKGLVERLRQKTAQPTIPSAVEVWKWHFRALSAEFGPRINAYITHCVASMDMDPSEVEEHVLDYAERLRREKQPIEENNDDRQISEQTDNGEKDSESDGTVQEDGDSERL